MRLVGLTLSALAMSALALAAPASAAPVTVNVTGVRTNVGKVIVSLCTKRQFGVSACTYTTATPARTGGVSVVFNTVAPGRYMAAAFQDLDGDGELRFTLTGPGEPAGVSGPERRIPDFAKAAFDVDAEPKAVGVRLR